MLLNLHIYQVLHQWVVGLIIFHFQKYHIFCTNHNYKLDNGKDNPYLIQTKFYTRHTLPLCQYHKDLLCAIQVHDLINICQLSQIFSHTFRNLHSSFYTNHNYTLNNGKATLSKKYCWFNIRHILHHLHNHKGLSHKMQVYVFQGSCIKVI